MPKFTANASFQFGGRIVRENASLEISVEALEKEIAKGKHPKDDKRFLSGLLNHCTPADDATAALLSGVVEEKEKEKEQTKEEKDAEIAEIRAEFERIGKAFSRNWGLRRLRDELIKAKKETGE